VRNIGLPIPGFLAGDYLMAKLETVALRLIVAIQISLLGIFAEAAPYSQTALKDLKNFRIAKLNQRKPPCPSADCQVTWGSAALALGDAGEYARRLRDKRVQRYATSIGISQNFELLKQLENLPPSLPYHFDESFQIKIQNMEEIRKLPNTVANIASDTRPIVGIRVNDIPADVILDTGASIHLAGDTEVAKTLDKLTLKTGTTTGLGHRAYSGFSTAKRVEVGNAAIRDFKVSITEGRPVSGSSPSPIGLLGYDFLLRFRSVRIDLINGVVDFNPGGEKSNCAPMELMLNRNRVPAGFAVKLIIDGEILRARIDTGAGAGILIHGDAVLKSTVFEPVPGIRLTDSRGTLTTMEFANVSARFAERSSTQLALRTPMKHPDVDVTLGVKFFNGTKFTLDFEHHQLCIE
jgi:hypothetical protein